MQTYAELKKSIDLVNFLFNHGYQVSDKSWKGCTVMKNDHGEVLLVRKNSVTNEWYYTNPNDSRDKGDIIFFVCRRFNLDFKKDAKGINELLKNFSLSPIISTYKKPKEIEKEKESIFYKEGLRPLNKRLFLNKRGIKDDVLSWKCFQGRILNFVQQTNKIVNIAFPYFDENDNVVGAELKNIDFSQAAEGSLKAQGVWHSNFHDVAYKQVYLGETVLDLISYSQIHLDDSKDNFFISGNGNFSKKQLQIMDNFSQKEEVVKIFLINDNDRQGQLFDLVQCGFIGEGRYNSKVLVRDVKFENKVVLEIVDKNLQLLDHRVKDEVEKLFFDFLGEVKSDKIEVVFAYKEGIFNELCSMVLLLRGLEKVIEIVKPEERFKDFNDQLTGKVFVKDLPGHPPRVGLSALAPFVPTVAQTIASIPDAYPGL